MNLNSLNIRTEAKMKKISLGPVFERLLGLMNQPDGDTILPDLTHQQREDLRIEFQKALAAEDISDFAMAANITVINKVEKRYLIALKFTWSWPVPVALEVQVVDQKEWIIEVGTNHKNI